MPDNLLSGIDWLSSGKTILWLGSPCGEWLLHPVYIPKHAFVANIGLTEIIIDFRELFDFLSELFRFLIAIFNILIKIRAGSFSFRRPWFVFSHFVKLTTQSSSPMKQYCKTWKSLYSTSVNKYFSGRSVRYANCSLYGRGRIITFVKFALQESDGRTHKDKGSFGSTSNSVLVPHSGHSDPRCFPAPWIVRFSIAGIGDIKLNIGRKATSGTSLLMIL